MQSGLMGVLTGSVIGGTLHSKESYISFIERNQGTAFQNVFEAKKELQTKVRCSFYPHHPPLLYDNSKEPHKFSTLGDFEELTQALFLYLAAQLIQFSRVHFTLDTCSS